MRSTLNIKHNTPADLAKALRSAAAKIELDQIVPGADIRVGAVRVQVAVPQENDIRAFARANGFKVGTRGVISNEVKAAFAAHQKAERARVRQERADRKAAREAAQAETLAAV